MSSFALYAMAMTFAGILINAFATGFMVYAGLKLASRLFGPIKIDLGQSGNKND